MEENQARPFFLYFASHDIHVPRVPHERFQGKTKLGWRGDAILQLDWSVGELISAVEKLGLAENTLIVFCSDNGPVMDDGYQDQAIDKVGSHRAAGPFSGGKYSVFEGGTRTPFITYWAGTIRPGESSQMVSTIDLARSFADLAKQPVPPAALPDSQNVLAALVGQPGARGRDHVVQQNNPGNALGLRMLVDGRDWKLHHTPAKQTYNLNINETLKSTAVPEFQLFDLAADPAEKSDLSEKHPDILQMLSQRLKDIRGEGAERPQK
jgi:arylsulfatase A